MNQYPLKKKSEKLIFIKSHKVSDIIVQIIDIIMMILSDYELGRWGGVGCRAIY